MNTKNKRISDLKKQIDDLQGKLDSFELDPDDYEEQFNEMLDEQGDIHIGNLTYSPSYVLKEVDPTAYRVGVNDYIDSIDVSDDPKYQELESEMSDLQNELDNLESI